MMSDINELNLKTLLEHAHIGVVIHRYDTSIVYANPTALRLLRLNYEQMIGKDAFDPQWSFLDDAGKKLLIDDYPVNKVKRTNDRLSNEVIGIIDSSRAEISWVMVNAYLEGTSKDNNSFIIVTFTDVSDSKELFSFQDIVENTQDVVIVTEAEDIKSPTGPKIVYVNKALERLTGYKKQDIIGETPRVLQGTLTDNDAKRRIHKALEDNLPVTETLLNYDSTGRPYWVEMNIIPLKNKYGEVTHFAAIERDISERKFHQEQLEQRNKDLKELKRNLETLVEERTLELQKAKAKLEKIAFFDPLTNIPNRRFFIDQANKLFSACSRRDSLVAVGLIDIDNFKVLNDTYGHDVGDAVLVKLAEVFTHLFRIDDAYCRFGGEEFAFAVAISQTSDAEAMSHRLLSSIRDIKLRTEAGHTLAITASLGINVQQATPEMDLEKELKQADMAMYEAKKSGKDQFVLTRDPSISSCQK
ncbi:diguanylate cyclase [Litoribacillus peritrichatus]|uniref:Diguanylate cyclase n=1 Tax=Litoribacillus peritrichatus TaxID=718191 RepID=A0ABP7MFZ9_9GAMM